MSYYIARFIHLQRSQLIVRMSVTDMVNNYYVYSIAAMHLVYCDAKCFVRDDFQYIVKDI